MGNNLQSLQNYVSNKITNKALRHINELSAQQVINLLGNKITGVINGEFDAIQPGSVDFYKYGKSEVVVGRLSTLESMGKMVSLPKDVQMIIAERGLDPKLYKYITNPDAVNLLVSRWRLELIPNSQIKRDYLLQLIPLIVPYTIDKKIGDILMMSLGDHWTKFDISSVISYITTTHCLPYGPDNAKLFNLALSISLRLPLNVLNSTRLVSAMSDNTRGECEELSRLLHTYEIPYGKIAVRGLAHNRAHISMANCSVCKMAPITKRAEFLLDTKPNIKQFVDNISSIATVWSVTELRELVWGKRAGFVSHYAKVKHLLTDEQCEWFEGELEFIKNPQLRVLQGQLDRIQHDSENYNIQLKVDCNIADVCELLNYTYMDNPLNYQRLVIFADYTQAMIPMPEYTLLVFKQQYNNTVYGANKYVYVSKKTIAPNCALIYGVYSEYFRLENMVDYEAARRYYSLYGRQLVYWLYNL